MSETTSETTPGIEQARGLTRPAGRLEPRLAALLSWGTWIACAVIAVGLVTSGRIAALGIALVIALPVVRVVVMLGWYVRVRDLRLAAICGGVLTILLLGLALGAAG
ncbi:MAG TPA: hypothetical protein VH165_25230 [Kofleriaceae bacterium]|nr:hypothetical protein [Kofleriaceae bacterium]